MESTQSNETKVCTGSITHFDTNRGFGFISSRQDNGIIQTFFFHASRIVYSEVDPMQIKTGQFALFQSDGTHASGRLPAARDIEIHLRNPLKVKAASGVAELSGREDNEPKAGS